MTAARSLQRYEARSRAASSPSSYTTTGGTTDFWGGDIFPHGLQVSSEEQCSKICAADLTCKLYTYNSRQQRCFPKRALEIPVITEGMGVRSGVYFAAQPSFGNIIAGPLIAARFRLHERRSYTAAPWHLYQDSRRLETMLECLRFCDGEDGCNYLTFGPRTENRERCTAFSDHLFSHRNSAAVSFERTNEQVQPERPVVHMPADDFVPRIGTLEGPD